MHGLGLFFALMESLGGSAKPPASAERSTGGVDPVERLDDATFDAWSAWARSARRRSIDPVGPAVTSMPERPAQPVVRPGDRGVLGRI